MAKLLIAGYGFLGRALQNHFGAAGWEVTTLNRSGKEGAIACDLSSSNDVSSLPGHYDLVIHCAASGGGGEESYRKVYLEGTRKLLKRFPDTPYIFTSSTSVYAQQDHSWVSEESPATPSSSTAKILRQSEDLALGAGGMVARLSGLYGPGRCHVLKNFLSGEARMDGQGERIMNFIHCDDVANAMLMLARMDPFPSGEIYNVTAEPVSQHDCYLALAEHFELPMPRPHQGLVKRKRGNSSKRVSNTKLKGIGWQPIHNDFLSLALACQEA
jgi:nucleoside-diphosphate-sugar epimerase